jgi:uncharacterized protein
VLRNSIGGKIIIGAFAALIVAVSIYFALQLKFEEDISKIIPADEISTSLSTIYNNTKVSERLAVNISLSDSSTKGEENKLIDYANDFVQHLDTDTLHDLIKEIQYKINDRMLDEVISVFYNNLPLFISEKDYRHIDTLITESNITNALKKDYKILVTPASMVLKKYILRDPFGFTYIGLNKLRNSQFADDYLIQDGYIFTRNKKNLLIFLSCAYPASETGRNSTLIDSLDSIIQKLNSKYKNEIKASYFGGAAVAVSNASRIKKDITLTVILSFVLLLIFIRYFVRVRWAAILTFLPALFGGIVSMAILYLVKGKVSSISLGLGSILLAIGVDYGLYVFSYLQNTNSTSSFIKRLIYPIFLCAITSTAVFYCLMYVQTEVLRDLGLFMAFSIIGAAFFSIAFLPSLIRFNKQENITFLNGNRKNVFQWLFDYRFDKNIILISTIVLASVVFFFSSALVDFDSDLQKMNYMNPKLKEAKADFDSVMNFSLKSVYIVASGKHLEEALQVNDHIYDIIEDLRNKNIVKGVSSVSPFVSSNSVQQKRIEVWNKYWSDTKKRFVKNALIKEGARYNFNPDAFHDFNNMINKKYTTLNSPDKYILSQILQNNFLIDRDSCKMIISLLKVDDKDRETIYSTFSRMNNVAIGDQQYFAVHLLNVLKENFNFLVNVSSLVVLIILILAFGRIELGLAAFIPIKLSWMWIVGIMGLFGIKFTIFNIIVSTLIFSTGVDYCILIMYSLQKEYAYGMKTLSFNKYAIFLSSSTTIISVGVLFFAQHPAMLSIGLLPIIGYLSVVILTFTIEPIIVSWLMLKKKERGRYPVTILTCIYTMFAYTYFLSGCLLLTITGFIIAKAPIMSIKKRRHVLHVGIQYFCKSMIYIMINIKKKVINTTNEKFDNPAVIICNHQSVLDILLVLMLNDKLILLTNDWVWNSPFFGKIVQYAQFYPVSSGIEEGIPKLAQKVKEGYSIVIFPEGSRSIDSQVHRFHKGAFYIAEKLNLDILPIVFHGTGDTIKKDELWVRNGSLTVKILPRIKADNLTYGFNYSERSKAICKYFRCEYDILKGENEKTSYFKDKLIKNYLYKEVILEWYLRIKLMIENNYSQIISLIPTESSVVDIGCGYGFLSYMLIFTSEKRTIIGIDYDKRKIDLANNCFSKNSRINFFCDDIINMQLPKSDAFILFDILHYLKREEQELILSKCVNNLNEDGIIIIRDANENRKNKHLITRLGELFSTGLGFNKLKNDHLNYFSDDFIYEIGKINQLDVRIQKYSKITSNQMFVLKRKAADTSDIL